MPPRSIIRFNVSIQYPYNFSWIILRRCQDRTPTRLKTINPSLIPVHHYYPEQVTLTGKREVLL